MWSCSWFICPFLGLVWLANPHVLSIIIVRVSVSDSLLVISHVFWPSAQASWSSCCSLLRYVHVLFSDSPLLILLIHFCFLWLFWGYHLWIIYAPSLMCLVILTFYHLVHYWGILWFRSGSFHHLLPFANLNQMCAPLLK